MTAQFVLLPTEADNLALYIAADDGAGGDPAGALYFLYIRPTIAHIDGRIETFPDTLTYSQSWGIIGAYFFATLIKTPKTLNLEALQSAIGIQGGVNNRGVAWVEGPQSATPKATTLLITYRDANGGQINQQDIIPFMNLGLQIPSSSEVEIDFTNAPRLIVKKGQGSGPQLARINNGAPVSGRSVSPTGEQVSISFDVLTQELGTIVFEGDWEARRFYAMVQDNVLSGEAPWGGEIRYFQETALTMSANAGPQQLVFPLIPPQPTGLVRFAFNVQLDPLAPEDPHRTAFMLADGVGPTEALSSNFLRTVSGDVINLTPQSGMGFYLGKRWDSKEPNSIAAYLGLMGKMSVNVETQEKCRVMCGLSGLEYIALEQGDTLILHPAMPAFADLVDTTAALNNFDETGEAPILQDTCTTSWISIEPLSQEQNTANKTHYFSQPLSGANFDKNALVDTNYSVATAARIVPLENTKIFPLGIYGGLYPPTSSDKSWPNDGTSGKDFAEFEAGVLGPARYERLATQTATSGPTLCDEAGEPISGGKSITPTGLLAELGDGGPNPALLRAAGNAKGIASTPAGNFAQLVLGKSDRGPVQFKANASGEVDGKLVRSLLNNQTFLVLNNWTAFESEFDSDVNVREFILKLAPMRDQVDKENTILIFKYADTESLETLVDRVSNWDDPAYFVGGTQKVQQAQKTIQAAIADARAAEEKHPGPFTYFLDTIVSDPSWTGFIVFNAPVDGRTMPADFQMVLGGIDGQLRAHHFGVEANKIIIEDGGKPEVQETSFFGVFYYSEDDENEEFALSSETDTFEEEDTYRYRTTELIIVIANSAIGQFSSEVALTMNELFERDVTGVFYDPVEKAWIMKDDTKDRNTLRVSGDYQVINGIGHIIFTAKSNSVLAFNPQDVEIRVLDKFAIKGATLSPISADGDAISESDSIQVNSRISLMGQLAFSGTPFPRPEGAPPIDLFGYGMMTGDQLTGLPINGLAFDIGFKLGPQGREGDIEIAPQFGNLSAKELPSAIRAGAMIQSFPMTMSGFLTDETDLADISKNAKLVNIPDLMASGENETDGEPNLNTVRSINPVTPTPRFALRFEIPLGSLGDQATLGVGLSAGLVVGWGPNTSMVDVDGISVFVQLPALEGGVAGFDLQGLVKTTFGDANLGRVHVPDENNEGSGKDVYVLLFNNVAISVFGIQLPPKVITDFVLFSDPANPAQSDLAWSLAATQVT